jgi:hypothetical protein
MMPPPPLKQKRRNVALGILLLARGRADGLAQFDATPRAVLQALAPLAAMMIVSLGLAIVSRAPTALQSYLLAGAVGLLSQLVLSYEVARRWGRGAEWYRFAAAFCWCQWAAPVAMLALILIMSVMLAAGVGEDTAAVAGLIGLLGYGLWLHWFLAWRALELSKWRALALVLIVNAATLVLINLPEWASGAG